MAVVRFQTLMSLACSILSGKGSFIMPCWSVDMSFMYRVRKSLLLPVFKILSLILNNLAVV